MKVEKVVNVPMNPTPMISRVVSENSREPAYTMNQPISRQPITLMNNVPMGKRMLICPNKSKQHVP